MAPSISRWQRIISRLKFFGYKPKLTTTDIPALLTDISEFFGMPLEHVKKEWSEYRVFSEERRYAETLSERKTLCMEEAFILYIMLQRLPLGDIVEIGTQYGRSTRRIIDMKKKLGLVNPITAFDVEDQVRFFERDEAQLIVKDVTHTFAEDVLSKHPAGSLLYLDAHPYHLLNQVIQQAMQSSTWVLAVHDCTPGICNPQMRLDKNDPNVTSITGCWERYVLAGIFGIPNPLDPRLDRAETATHRMRIFATTHGLAVILPKAIKPVSSGSERQ